MSEMLRKHFFKVFLKIFPLRFEKNLGLARDDQAV